MPSSSTSLLPSDPESWRPNTRPKLQPAALLDIDQGPLYDIFTEWLLFEDVCRLDSALCNKKRRAEFLVLQLASGEWLFNREEVIVLDDPYQVYRDEHRALGAAALGWVLKRGIHLASLRLPDDLYINTAEQQSIRDAVTSLALNGRLDKLETISFNQCLYIEDADLAAVLSKCYATLMSIDIRECGLSESAAVHINIQTLSAASFLLCKALLAARTLSSSVLCAAASSRALLASACEACRCRVRKGKVV
jgi:hypothetical protein